MGVFLRSFSRPTVAVRERGEVVVCAALFCSSWPAVAARRRSRAGRLPRPCFVQVGAVNGVMDLSISLDLVALVATELMELVLLPRRACFLLLLQLSSPSDGERRRRYPCPATPLSARVLR